MNYFIYFFSLVLLLLPSCGGSQLSSQSEPVLLPTPFTGSLTPDTQFFVENGFVLGTGGTQQMRSVSLSADQSAPATMEACFPFFNPIGESLGTICATFPPKTFQDLGNVKTLTTTLTIHLNDGISTLTAENFQFIVFNVLPEESGPLPDTPPNTTPDLGSGVGWGLSDQGTGIYADKKECVINYRNFSEFQIFPDGGAFPFFNDHCECFVTCD